MRSNDLKGKSARGAMKLGIGTGAERVLRLIRYMILTRILAADQFGLIAIILVLVNLFEAFTEVGVKQSIIQNKRGADPEYLNVAWWFQALRGLGLFAVAAVAAPWISSLYDKPQLARLIQVASLAIVCRGFISPRAPVLEREYRFGRVVLLIQGSAVLGAIITIGLALITRNVWAMVVGYVAEQGIVCLLSYVLVPFLPRFGTDKKCFRELMKFARGMFGLPILTVVAGGAPVFVLGKLVTTEQLGMYYLAGMLPNLAVTLFTKVIQPVLLPGFSKMQDDKDSVRRALLQVTRGLAIFCVPFTALVASCASGMLLVVYGPQFRAVAVPCAVLSLLISVRTGGIILGTVYVAVGRPHLLRRFVALRAAMIVALIYPAVVYHDLVGAAVATILSSLAALSLLVFEGRKVIDLRLGSYVRSYVPGLLLALPIIVTVGLLRLFGIDAPVSVLITGAFVFIVTLAAGVFFLNHSR
ncbi:MAG: oligosaccharide flippase family protein [Phycisphaerales bacterium]